ILLIAGYFPPYAPVSATRVNKLAKYWHDLGHEVRVLAPRNAGFPPVMQPEIPAEQVIFTPIFEVIEVPGRIKTKVKAWLGRNTEKTPEAKAAVPPDTAAANTLKGPSFAARLSATYAGLVSTPDSRIGWYRHAVRAGRA